MDIDISILQQFANTLSENNKTKKRNLEREENLISQIKEHTPLLCVMKEITVWSAAYEEHHDRTGKIGRNLGLSIAIKGRFLYLSN